MQLKNLKNKMVKNNKSSKKISFSIVIGIICLIIIIIFLISMQQKTIEENILLKTLMKSNGELSKISIDKQNAESYYNEASIAYSMNEYKQVELNCRLAREHYAKESQGYKVIKAELISSGIQDKLIEIYIKSLDTNIEITDNMFEACEYFESASNYYYQYFSLNIDSGWEMGNREIEMMNKKIQAHDNAVDRYNNLLAEFNIELEKRIN